MPAYHEILAAPTGRARAINTDTSAVHRSSQGGVIRVIIRVRAEGNQFMTMGKKPGLLSAKKRNEWSLLTLNVPKKPFDGAGIRIIFLTLPVKKSYAYCTCPLRRKELRSGC